jgi:hypothetical protein
MTQDNANFCNENDAANVKMRYEFKEKRQSNQYRALKYPWDLTEGAEQLLKLIEKYQYRHNVTNSQYAALMGIPLRNLVFYMRELEAKDRIEISPKNKKRGRGKPNLIKINYDFDPVKWCQENGISYESYM